MMNSEQMHCDKCGKYHPEMQGSWWPGDEHESICQECWEEECSKSWWEMGSLVETEIDRIKTKATTADLASAAYKSVVSHAWVSEGYAD